MQEQSSQLDLLQRAVETMAEQLLAIDNDLAMIRRQIQASEQLQRHLMSRVDEIDAIRANLSLVERRLLLNRTPNQKSRRRASARRRLTWILLGLVSLLGGWIFTFRASLFKQSEHAAVLRQQPSRSTKPVNQILMITTQEPTWLEVQTSEGRLLHFGIAQTGQYNFPVVQSLRIRAGRPDLVRVSFQGSTAMLGTIESIGWHVYSRS